MINALTEAALAGSSTIASKPSPPVWKRTLARYAAALAVVAASIALRLALDPVIGPSGFAISLIGMLVAAWVGGLGPCLIAQTLILVANAAWFQPERPIHSPLTLQGLVSLVAFYSVGGIVAVLSEAWYAARQRAAVERADAKSQREQLLTTLSCIADGVLVTDAAGCVRLMNPAAEAMTGWKLDEVRGKPVRDILALCEPSLDAIDSPVRRVLRENQPHRKAFSLMLTTRNEARLPVSYSAAPIRTAGGGALGIVMVLRDETERMEAERALHAADRRKDEFLATLAHELRNPLAPIAMGLELIKLAGDDPVQTEEVRAMMERQTQQMVRLIDDLLDVSRITRGKLELRKDNVLLADVVRDAVEAIQPAVDEGGHELKVDLPERPVLLSADGGRLTQVFSNLLNNAAKYTPRNGRIALAADERDGHIEIAVDDNGRGIPPDELESVFDMFAQVRDAKEHGHQGLGIGLTLVKRIVELHGGTVTAHSEGPGTGSRFVVRLPAANPPAEPARRRPDAKPPRQLDERVVLIVDDNPDIVRTLSILVRQFGSVAHQASDGEEAVAVAQRVRPEIILMDLGMPKLNGFDAARQIREAPWGRDVLLVATTGWGQDEDRRRTKHAGFDRHLVKPINPEQLEVILLSPSRRQSSERANGDVRHHPRQGEPSNEYSYAAAHDSPAS